MVKTFYEAHFYDSTTHDSEIRRFSLEGPITCNQLHELVNIFFNPDHSNPY